MAASIQNISLSITSETGLQDALQGVITQSFTLTDYEDGSDTPVLTSGRTGEIGSALYRVEDGDFTIDVTGLSGDGTYYIYIEDEGASVTAYADDTVPTWSETKGGFYNGNAKAFFRFYLSGSDYNDRADIIQSKGYLPEDITVTNITASGTITGDVTGDLTGNVAGNITGNIIWKISFSFEDTDPSQGDVFTALNNKFGSILSNGDKIICSGGATPEAAEIWHYNFKYIEKTSATLYKILSLRAVDGTFDEWVVLSAESGVGTDFITASDPGANVKIYS